MPHVCPSWLSFLLYNPIRKAFTDREEILKEAGISADSVVLEVGAGNGFLTEALASRAKKVLSLELQAGMIRKLRKRVQRFGDKVEIVIGDIATYRISADFVDVCLLYYCFHEISNKTDASKNISRAVKIGGTLSIYEPGIEVNKTDMQKTIIMFEQLGFKRELERNTIFTKFARLKKI